MVSRTNVSHVKLGLCLTCAKGNFYTHPSISQTGCLPYRGQQTSSSISWDWRLALSRIRPVRGSEAAATRSWAYNTHKPGSSRGGGPGQRCPEHSGPAVAAGPAGTVGPVGRAGSAARPAAPARPHGNAPPRRRTSAPSFHGVQSPTRRGGSPSFYWTILTLINACGVP